MDNSINESRGMPTPIFLPKKIYNIIGTDRGYKIQIDGEKIFKNGKIDFVKLTETMIVADVYPEFGDDEFFGIKSIEIVDGEIIITGQAIKLSEVKFYGQTTTAE